MNAIFSLWQAAANLARALNRLASIADNVADEAERRVEAGQEHAPAIEAEPKPALNGRARRAVTQAS